MSEKWKKVVGWFLAIIAVVQLFQGFERLFDGRFVAGPVSLAFCFVLASMAFRLLRGGDRTRATKAPSSQDEQGDE